MIYYCEKCDCYYDEEDLEYGIIDVILTEKGGN